MSRRGIPLVVSAPSGAGKTTLCNMLLAQFTDIHYSVSCTTRRIRGNERHGVDYYFLSEREFLNRRDQGQFAEWARVHGNYYGTPLDVVRDKLAQGKDMLLDVDVQGAAQIRQSLPDAKFVFILPPSLEELEKRLRKRNFDDPETIRVRLGNALEEIRKARDFDAVIVNADLAVAYAEFRSFYIAATLAPALSCALDCYFPA